MGSTPKGKNLLPEEQILSFRSGSLLGKGANIVELLPLKEYHISSVIRQRVFFFHPKQSQISRSV